MARFKMCVCGEKSIANRRDLCKDCLKDYGTDKDEWPEWLKFAVKDTQRTYDYDRRHDDLEVWDSADTSEEDDDVVIFGDDDEVVTDDEKDVALTTALDEPAPTIGKDQAAILEAALATLNDEQAQAIILQANGYTVREIADQMGVSVTQAQRLITAARAELADFGTAMPLISREDD